MVDAFTSAKPYSFTVDGKALTLPGLSFGDVDTVAEAMSGDIATQLTAAKTILFSRSNKTTQDAIKSLSIADLGKLFRKWAGVESGESEPSAE
jgi:hypothetical protein